MLYDFQHLTDVKNWYEISDTVRPKGQSSALLEIYDSGFERFGVFSSSLKEMSAGVSFCSVRTHTQLNLAGYEHLSIKCKGEGNAKVYKILLTHSNSYYPNPTFEQSFEVCQAIFGISFMHPK